MTGKKLLQRLSKKPSFLKTSGFTLMELLIVVVIIAIMALVLPVKIKSMIQGARDGEVKTKLGMLRASLNIYYSDNLARFPVAVAGEDQTTLADNLTPKYLKEIPTIYVYPYHEKTNLVDDVADGDFLSHDSSGDGGWAYVSVYAANDWGRLIVECYHNDGKGTLWSTH